jgi:hypothetical protein
VHPDIGRSAALQSLAGPPGPSAFCPLHPIPISGARIRCDLFSVALKKKERSSMPLR